MLHTKPKKCSIDSCLLSASHETDSRDAWDLLNFWMSDCLHSCSCTAPFHFIFLAFQDCSHLTTYGETVESLQIHNERLQNNAACHDEATGRPRLRATALDRHKELRSLTLSDALLLFPFLGTEALVSSSKTLCFLFCLSVLVAPVYLRQ